MSEQDIKHMQAALKLAKRGLGLVEPNPAVGCIIVKRNQIIGKGWHKKFGGPHAEINALEDCKNLGASARGATMYVTLEPCCHEGKTGPCIEAIIAAKPERVVVATIDPSEHMCGRGIEKMRSAGIQVDIDICKSEARLLNAPFFKFAVTGKCWVILKWAQSIDGRMAWAGQSGEQRWISGEKSRKDTQQLRRRAGAILVGIGTVFADDPLLTVRPARGKQIVRVVLDSHLRIPLDCKLLATVKKAPVLIVAWEECVQLNPETVEKIRKKGAEVFAYPDTQGRSNLHFVIDELSRRGITQLLVEGGPKVIASFFKERLADEICVYIAPKVLGGCGSSSSSITESVAELSEAISLHYTNVECFDDDVRITGLSEKAVEEISAATG